MARKVDLETFKEYLGAVKDLIPGTLKTFSENADKSRNAKTKATDDVYERIKAEQELCIEKLRDPQTPTNEQEKYFKRLQELGKEFVENRDCLINAEKEADKQFMGIAALALVAAAIPLADNARKFVIKNLPQFIAENAPKLLKG